MQTRFSNFNESERTDEFRKLYFPNATDENWADWRWQLSKRITNIEKLEKIIELSNAEKTALTCKNGLFPFSIPLIMQVYYIVQILHIQLEGP